MIYMWSAIAILFCVTVIGCSLVLRNRMQLRALEHSLNSNIQTLRRELAVVSGGAVGVGSRLINVEKKLKESIEKQQQLQIDSAEHFSYEEAVSLAEDGADASQITAKCGLSEAEANLMTLLNNKTDLNITNCNNA